jgi:tetrahydromethanopterin S-methyltransferase subunit G
MTERDLLELKEEIEIANTEVSQLTGQQMALTKQLQEDWKCSNVKEAKAKVEELDKKIDRLERQIEKGIKELEEKYQ